MHLMVRFHSLDMVAMTIQSSHVDGIVQLRFIWMRLTTVGHRVKWSREENLNVTRKISFVAPMLITLASLPLVVKIAG